MVISFLPIDTKKASINKQKQDKNIDYKITM